MSRRTDRVDDLLRHELSDLMRDHHALTAHHEERRGRP